MQEDPLLPLDPHYSLLGHRTPPNQHHLQHILCPASTRHGAMSCTHQYLHLHTRHCSEMLHTRTPSIIRDGTIEGLTTLQLHILPRSCSLNYHSRLRQHRQLGIVLTTRILSSYHHDDRIGSPCPICPDSRMRIPRCPLKAGTAITAFRKLHSRPH